MKSNQMRWLILILIGLVVLSMKGTLPKEAVADVEGKPCLIDEDCPCWGQYNGTSTGYGTDYDAVGIGVATCSEGVCDTTYCVDVEPVGEWVKDNPWAYLRDNVFLLVGLIALAGMVFMWPK